jgi:hypothetical protein
VEADQGSIIKSRKGVLGDAFDANIMPALVRLRAPAIGRALLLLSAAAAVGIVCGRVAISHYAISGIEMLIAGGLLVFVVPRPFVSTVLLLCLLVSAPLYTYLPRVSLPGHPPINIGDVALAAAIGGTIWRNPWRTWPTPVRSYFAALCLMLAVATIATISLALHGHSQAREAIFGFVDLLYLAAGLIVALDLTRRFWWPTINFAIALAAVVSVVSLLTVVSGSVASLLNQIDPGAALAAAGSTSRIRLSGLFFVYAMTLPTLVLVTLIRDQWRVARIGALILMVATIAVSLNRNMYFGALAGLVITLLMSGAQLRYRALVSVGAVVAVLFLAVQLTVGASVTSEVSARAGSALTTQVLSSGSLETRATEFDHALVSISQHPLAGVGWDQNYGDFTSANYAGTVPRVYVEDWYLHLATDLGLPVAAIFVLLMVLLLSCGVRQARRARAPLDRALVGALLGSVVAMLLSAVVGTYLQDPNSMTAFGFTCGLLLATALRASRRATEADELTLERSTAPVGAA